MAVPPDKTRAVAGAIKTPTPQLNATAVGVILNPWWEVPPSISREAAGKPGYVSVKGKDGKVQRWRQPPGPTNALGQLKFVMYNPQNIYLHDTNAPRRLQPRDRAAHSRRRPHRPRPLRQRDARAQSRLRPHPAYPRPRHAIAR